MLKRILMTIITYSVGKNNEVTPKKSYEITYTKSVCYMILHTRKRKEKHSMAYNRSLIARRYRAGEQLHYVFFSGHTVTNPLGKTCMSQWYPCDFTVEGITYHTAEQYMMARKALLFGDDEAYGKIMAARSPKTCKALGRGVRNFDPAKWDLHKYDIVVTANVAKFSQNEEFKEYLLSTGDAVIVEASPWDRIWGIGRKEDTFGITNPDNWNGTNLLGFALMEARDIIREAGK